MKTFMKGLTLSLFVLITASLFLSCEKKDTGATGSTSSSDDVTQITFMSPLGGADGSHMDSIIQGFNEANPDVQVTHFVVDDSTEYKQKFSTGVSTDSAPEVLLIRKFDMPLYMDQFTGFTAADFNRYGIDINDIYPNLMEGLTVDGKIVGIPLDVWIFYMAYNKGNFREAGLDPEKAPTNKKEFIDAMEALKAVTPEGITPYYENTAWTWIWSQMLWQFGGDLLNDDFTKPAFMEAGTEALYFLLDLQQRGIVPSGAIDPGPAFEGGDASCLITGIWTINPWSGVLGDDFGYAVAPQLGNTNAVFGGSHVIALADTMVQDPAKKEAAMRWVKYLWDHMIDWYAAGQTPSRISIAEGEELKEKLPRIWTVAQQMQYVKSFQMFPYISEVQGELAVFLEAVLYTGEMTPEEAMEQAAEAVQFILDDYWAAN